MIKKFLGQTLKEKLVFWLGLTINTIGGTLTLLIPLLIRKLIDKGFNIRIIILIVLLGIVSTILISVSSYILFSFSEKQIKNLRDKLIKNLMYKHISFYDHNNSSRLSSRIINDTENLRNFLANNIPEFINGIIVIIGGSLMLFLLDWKLAIVILVGLIMLVLILNPLSQINGKYIKKRQLTLSYLSAFLTESFQQIRIIKSNQSESHSIDASKNYTFNLFKISKKSSFIDSLITPLVFFTLSSILIIIFTYGGIRVSQNSISTGTLISFFIYLIQLLTPISKVGNFFNNLAKTKGSIEEVMKVFNIKNEKNTKGTKISDIDSLILNNVYFSYNQSNKLTLSNISMELQKGQKISIVGPSGSGKSTLIALIEHFYSCEKGEILINNINIDDIDLKDLRKQITLITQDNTLLTGSIYENLVSGLKDVPKNEEIVKSLKYANIYNEIKSKDNDITLFSDIGEKGANLSEGQKQRIQIAKAFLRNSSIIIFDEATSNLDSNSEKIIMDYLNKIRKDKIIINIAHQLSSIIDSDYIYFIEKGEITGKGKHHELINKHNEYRNFIFYQQI